MGETKKIKELKAKLKELERLHEQKDIEIEFNEKVIEIASEVYNIDIKKKFGPAASGDSGSQKENPDEKW